MKRKTQTAVKQREAVPSDDAKRKLVEIWLEHDGNEARQILQAFKIGFEDASKQLSL